MGSVYAASSLRSLHLNIDQWGQLAAYLFTSRIWHVSDVRVSPSHVRTAARKPARDGSSYKYHDPASAQASEAPHGVIISISIFL